MLNPEHRRPLRVFLCHSHIDKAAVRDLCRQLRDDGFDPWLDDERLLPGQDWELEIRKAVRTTDAVIVCLSRTSVTKAGFFQKEIRQVLDIADEKPDGAVYLIPWRLEACEVPERLRRWQWVDSADPFARQKLQRSLSVLAAFLRLNLAAPVVGAKTTSAASAVASADRPRANQDKRSGEPDPLRQVQVVWFDDNPAAVQEVRQKLTDTGISVGLWSNLFDVRDHLVQSVDSNGGPPDVIITDWRIDNSPHEDGMHLVLFADGLYRSRLKVPARIGVVSAYPEGYRDAAGHAELAFTYPIHDLIDNRLNSFVSSIRLEARRFRRDRWCQSYASQHPLDIGSVGEFSPAISHFGVITAMDSDSVTVDLWTLDSIRSEATRRFGREAFDQAGRFCINDAIRLVERWDTSESTVARSIRVCKVPGFPLALTRDAVRPHRKRPSTPRQRDTTRR